jgi:GNAT superfamily N-acetyltransferase
MTQEAAAEYRAAQRGDLPSLLALYRQLNPDDPALDDAQADELYKQMLAHPGLTIFVADIDGVPVSSVTLVVIPNLTRGGAPYALIENVVTHSAHRKRGHARSLIDKAVSSAWAAGCYKVMLLTGKKEEETLRFYANCGFSQNKTGFQIRRP